MLAAVGAHRAMGCAKSKVDNRAPYAVGQIVMFKEDFIGDSANHLALQKGETAAIKQIDGVGDVQLDLGDGRTTWVLKKKVGKLGSVTPADATMRARGKETWGSGMD